MRQTIFGLTVNIVQSLASSAVQGEMDSSALSRLLDRLQSKEMIAHFGLNLVGTTLDLARNDDDSLLISVDEITKFLSEVLEAGAVSVGKPLFNSSWQTS
jgi:hypothetical protein